MTKKDFRFVRVKGHFRIINGKKVRVKAHLRKIKKTIRRAWWPI